MSSDAQSNYAKSLGKLLEQTMVAQQGRQGQTPSSCLMVELCKQNQRLRDLHAALAAATFGVARLGADGGDDDIISLLGSVGQSARVSGITVLACETTLAGQSLRAVHRWGSAVRPSGQMTLDVFAVAGWRESLLAGQPVVGDLGTFDSDAKLALVTLGIHSLAAIPVVVEESLVGVVVFEDTAEDQTWNEEETGVLRLIAWSLISAMMGPDASTTTSAFPAIETMGALSVLCLDEDRRVSYWSRGAERLFGYTPEEAVGRECVELIVPEAQRELMNQAIDQAFQTPGDDLAELQLQHRDGRSVWVRATSHVERHEEGTGTLYWVGMDITELHDVHEEKVALNRHLMGTRKMETVAHLIGGLAHHTNNSLAVIQGNAELIRMQYTDDPELQEMIGEILTGVNDTARLTGQLKSYSQAGSHDRSRVDVHDMIRKVASECRQKCQSAPMMTLEITADESELMVCESELAMSLASLIDNACEATAEGGEVTVSTETVDFDEGYCALQSSDIRPGTYLCITVEDTGHGMDNQTLQRAFEPFFSTKPFGQGHGLGLANVYGCVRNHKGTVLLSSMLDRGTTVQMFLPVRTEGDTPTDAPEEVATTVSKGRIVIVEDEEASRETLEAILAGAGYQVVAFKMVAEAMAYYREQWTDVDVVTLDMHIPGMTGRELFAEIREINPDAHCLLSSRLLLASDAQAMLDNGAAGFLAKPYNTEAVVRQITKLLPR
jgi:two-component system, cell cycle sensor histidine kinase and response regulator CckA